VKTAGRPVTGASPIVDLRSDVSGRLRAPTDRLWSLSSLRSQSILPPLKFPSWRPKRPKRLKPDQQTTSDAIWSCGDQDGSAGSRRGMVVDRIAQRLVAKNTPARSDGRPPGRPVPRRGPLRRRARRRRDLGWQGSAARACAIDCTSRRLVRPPECEPRGSRLVHVAQQWAPPGGHAIVSSSKRCLGSPGRCRRALNWPIRPRRQLLVRLAAGPAGRQALCKRLRAASLVRDERLPVWARALPYPAPRPAPPGPLQFIARGASS
jgi:hypothetical protein